MARLIWGCPSLFARSLFLWLAANCLPIGHIQDLKGCLALHDIKVKNHTEPQNKESCTQRASRTISMRLFCLRRTTNMYHSLPLRFSLVNAISIVLCHNIFSPKPLCPGFTICSHASSSSSPLFLFILPQFTSSITSSIINIPQLDILNSYRKFRIRRPHRVTGI